MGGCFEGRARGEGTFRGPRPAQERDDAAARAARESPRWWWDEFSPAAPTLDDKTFDGFVEAKDFTVVEFFTPADKKSADFAPTYEAIARTMLDARGDVRFGRVNCGSDQSVAAPPEEGLFILGVGAVRAAAVTPACLTPGPWG